jgi:hypothetical protein
MSHLSPYSLAHLLEYGVAICVCTPNTSSITLRKRTPEAQSPPRKSALPLAAPHRRFPSLHRTHSQA